jgi:hypothetical protein
MVVGGTILHPSDNLDPSRRYPRDENVDLVYLDAQHEGYGAEHGLGSRRPRPTRCRWPRMAKDSETEIR